MDVKELTWKKATECMLGYAEATLEIDENNNIIYYFPSKLQLMECIFPELSEEIALLLDIPYEEAEKLVIAVLDELDYDLLESYASDLMFDLMEDLLKIKALEQFISEQVENIMHLLNTKNE